MRLFDWLENRTGVCKLAGYLLNEPIPGGARWRYVWGSTLVFAFALQVVTGVLLMIAYSPSTTNAWSSVWYIQTQMGLGWLIRGLHHFGSQAMIILLPIHVLQVVFARAYAAPREFNWWIGLVMAGVVAALALTGYLLPWDQKGYWATKVSTNILALTPVAGDALRTVLGGGSEYGHATLTRFFTLHVMVLPGSLAVLLFCHIALFRRHGVTVSPRVREGILAPAIPAPGILAPAIPAPDLDDPSPTLAAQEWGTRTGKELRSSSDKIEGNFWPDQVFRDLMACAAVLGIMFAAVGYTHYVLGEALLEAPADPASLDYPPRPEWYFLFLFQLLKYFEGPAWEVVGAIFLPGAVVAVFFAFPVLDKWLAPRRAHGAAVGFTMLMLAATGYLTYAAWGDDREPSGAVVEAIRAKQQGGASLSDSDLAVLRANEFNRLRKRAARAARRAFQLADQPGIPPEGPLKLLANDPLTRGPDLFSRHCAACHRYNGHNGLGVVPIEQAASSDLAGFASRAWIRGLLTDPTDPTYFGLMVTPEGVPAHTRMAKVVTRLLEENEAEDYRRELLENFEAVAAYLEWESLHPGEPATLLAGNVDAADERGADKLLADELIAEERVADERGASARVASERVPNERVPSERVPSERVPNERVADKLVADDLVIAGRQFFMAVCNECHSYAGNRSGTRRAPEMLGYGSVEWIERMIADPGIDTLYRSTGREPARMPAFKDRLSQRDRRLIATWLHDTR